MISDKSIIELCVLVQGEEREYYISGHNGRFNWTLLQEWEDGLSEEPPRELEDAINKTGIANGVIILFANMTEIEAETQYGTGYGDIYTLPAYYYFELIEVTKVEQQEKHEEVDECELIVF